MECENKIEDSAKIKVKDFRSVDVENECLKFGYARFRPAFLQFVNQPWCFLVVLMLFCIVQGTAILGIFTIVLPQIEKRFSLTSTEIGLIAGANDIAAVFFGIFISYYGDFGNKIRWISFGGIVTAIGMFLFTLPHYIAGRYHPPSTVDTSIKMCSLNSTENNDCPEGSAVDWYYMAIFCISQFIAGAGILPMHSMVPAYFEENVNKKLSPIYIAFWDMSIYVGPLIGFGLSDSLTSLYVDITLPPGLNNLTPEDPRWIGNWWIGFLVCAGLLSVISVILLGFPTHFQTDKRKLEKKIQNSAKRSKLHTFLTRFKEFLVAGKELMLNPVFVCHCLAVNIPRFVVDGTSPFAVKILLAKYGISATKVGLALAASGAPGIILGSLLGGFIVSKFNLKKSLKKSAFCCIVGSILVFVVPLAYLLPGCGNVNLAGLVVDYGKTLHNGSTLEFSKDDKFLQSSCNNKCGCTLQEFFPLCGSDNISYLDPCHAGCTAVTSSEPPVFNNCSCISPSTSPHGGSATLGFCPQGCHNWEWFLFLIALDTLFFFLIFVPSRIVVLRCVPENRQAFATGMHYFSLEIMANIPGPIVMGKIIDGSCKVWQHLCGKSGSCSVYDIDKMTMSIVLAVVISFVLGTVLFIISWWYCDTEDSNYEVNAVTVETNDHPST